jgi:radial spoke head protein 4/6
LPEEFSATDLDMRRDRQPPIDPNTGMPVSFEEPNTYTSEDMTRSAAMFEALGVGLDAQEMYQVTLQLKHRGEDPAAKLQSVRFFGKFFGMFADYYVFEGTPKNPAPVKAESADGAALIRCTCPQ